MGDRTWVSVEVPQAYQHTVLDIFGHEPQEVYQAGDMFEARWAALNYGGLEEHYHLVAQEIPHILTWGRGEGYGPGSLVHDGEATYEVDYLVDQACACLPVAPDGTINLTDLAAVLNYYQTVQQVRHPAEPDGGQAPEKQEAEP